MPNYVTQAEFDAYVSDERGAATADIREGALLAAERAVSEF